MTKSNRWLWMLSGALLTLIILFIALRAFPFLSSADALTEGEVRAMVTNQYSGEIVELNLLGDLYQIELATETGIYELFVDAGDGKIVALNNREIQTEPDGNNSGNTEASGDAGPEEVNGASNSESADPHEDNTVEHEGEILTRSQAAGIALAEVGGEVDDIEFRRSADLSFYLIEIELDNDREVIVQIHALTGDIMSITYDDDDWDQ